MRIIFCGTSYFGVPILEKMVVSKREIIAVITQPDRIGGRGRGILSSPVKKIASQFGLNIMQPENINSENTEREIIQLQPDLIILVAYGQILSDRVLQIPALGCLNIHPSLLPKYKGPAPINWALINGERETGITILFMNEKIDAGDIIIQKKIKILPDENFDQLSSRLALQSAELLEETLSALERGEYKRYPQPKEKYFYARKLNKNDCQIDWNRGAKEIYNLIRGLTSFPGAYTEFKGKRIKICSVSLLEKSNINNHFPRQKPGTIFKVGKNEIIVLTGDGNFIIIKRLIPAGSKEMDALEFINGYHIKAGDTFN